MTPKPLRGGLWNARRDRPPAEVRRHLRRAVRRHRLDFVLLQEFSDYVDELREHPIPGYRLVCPPVRYRGADQNPILVRIGLVVTRERVIRMSLDGWTTADGHHHEPVYSVALVLEGWLRLLSVHAPVSVSWVKGVPTGPPERVDDYLAHSDRAERFALLDERHGRRTVLGGDWNARAWERGIGTPHDLAERARLRIVEPSSRRGPGHDGIDYVLTDADVRAMRKRRTGGSDHPFVTFEVWP